MGESYGHPSNKVNTGRLRKLHFLVRFLSKKVNLTQQQEEEEMAAGDMFQREKG